MNNKGFTLIEVLVTLVIFSLITLILSNVITTTLAASKEETYELMKNNIIKSSYTYVSECKAKLIECDFSDKNNHTFKASELVKYNYFKNLKSPIDGKDLGECLTIKVTYNSGVSIIDINDDCY